MAKNSHFDFDDALGGSFSEDKAKAEKITAAISGSFSEDKTKAKEIRERKDMDAYWRDQSY